MRICGRVVDHHNREIFEGSIEVEGSKITAIHRHPTERSDYIMVGFIDAHVHIESSMLTPQNFGELAISHGTVAVVSDPHEIANVMGREGVDFMVSSGKRAPIKIFYTIPSCVPATAFDCSGGELTSSDVEHYAASGGFVALSEMMNSVGVLSGDEEVIAKILVAKKYRIPIDGHAPMLSGDDLKAYISHGITTDHECVTLSEAEEKITLGMKILIREGSAAKNYAALHSLIATSPQRVMFCTDDSHADDIIRSGEIDKIIVRALGDGYSIFDLLTIASSNPVAHYGIDVGQLRVGDSADFIIVEDLVNLKVKEVYIDGCCKYNFIDKRSARREEIELNNFYHLPITLPELEFSTAKDSIAVIGIIPSELTTTIEHLTLSSEGANIESDLSSDTLKIVYINRYQNGVPQVAFVRGFGLKQGAIASSIAHDSHNIIAVGCSDCEILEAVNALIAARGALVVNDGESCHTLPLPIAGIMSAESGEWVATQYGKLQEVAREIGCTLPSPFMTLSFLSLIVIPELKIGEKGLFSFSKFDWV